MDRKKKKRLEERGWVVGAAAGFLGLAPAEERYIELKFALGESLREARRERGLTQTDLARTIGSSQSRVAKMEAGDPTVSTDLILRALLELGLTNQELAGIFLAAGS